MPIQDLVFQNFRNFQSLDLPLNQGFVVLSGPNGAGKTNFLEGICFGASLVRFSESKQAQLFQDGKKFFKVKIQDPQDLLEIYCEKTPNGYSYKLKLNNQDADRLKYVSILPVITFLPQDLNLLTRSPGGRRHFLHEALSAVSAEYRYNHQHYEKALRQRNKLWQKIKSGEAKEEDLEIWDENLAEFGSQITFERGEFLKFLNLAVPKILENLSPVIKSLEFIYKSLGLPEKANFLAKLYELRSKEFETGTTIFGPHRDDFQAKLEGKEAVGYLSRGQLRAATLALKMAERKYLEEKTKTPPIILLDDIFSEFDHDHQGQLSDFLKGFEQVFITTTHLEDVKEFLPDDAQILAVGGGTVRNV